MRFAASVLDSLSSLLPPPNYMPMRQLPDNDEDVELRLLTADGSPKWCGDTLPQKSHSVFQKISKSGNRHLISLCKPG